MELKEGLACRRLDFHWPVKAPDAPPLLAAVEAVFSPGTVSLIIGETGVGKSTLLHLLGGLLRPTAGEVWADGVPVSRWPARHRDRWRRRVGIVFQHLGLIPDLSTAENLLLPLIPRDMTWAQMQREVHNLLNTAGLSHKSANPANTLSGGQRQRLAIARALAGSPRFILADEPTAFQDDDRSAQVFEQLRSAARDGAVVVICSHDPRLRTTRAVTRCFHLACATLTAVDNKEDGPCSGTP